MRNIDPEKIAFLIVKAREYDVKVAPEGRDMEAEGAEEDERGVLQDFAGDSTRQELHDFIDSLNDDEQYTLVALVWTGRGTYGPEEWQTALDDARAAANSRTADYLLGTPLLADYLEEGLSQLGISIEEYESGHL